jgi:hypothetical protein
MVNESNNKLDTATSAPVLSQTKQIKVTESAPEFEASSVAIITDIKEGNKKLVAVKSTDKQITSSSKSLKPITRGQIFRKQVPKK